MNQLLETIVNLLFFLLFAGIWIGFLCFIARVLVKKYESTPLQYVQINKSENSNVKHNKFMEKEHPILNFIIIAVLVLVAIWFGFSILKDFGGHDPNPYRGATPEELRAIEAVQGGRGN